MTWQPCLLSRKAWMLLDSSSMNYQAWSKTCKLSFKENLNLLLHLVGNSPVRYNRFSRRMQTYRRTSSRSSELAYLGRTSRKLRSSPRMISLFTRLRTAVSGLRSRTKRISRMWEIKCSHLALKNSPSRNNLQAPDPLRDRQINPKKIRLLNVTHCRLYQPQ